ncbi:MAG: hypothetical protein IPK79_08760 [Vampirovibrionales bacterium]|nr:hypothetical protein [Vampirovibrionales bacterium]
MIILRARANRRIHQANARQKFWGEALNRSPLQEIA